MPAKPHPTASRVCFTVTQFCAATSLCRRTVEHLWRTGRGPRRVYVGTKALIPASAIVEWLENMPTEPQEPLFPAKAADTSPAAKTES